MIRSHHFSAILTVTNAIANSTTADLLELLNRIVQAAGLNAVAEASATFSPQGISAVLLLEESHVALHIWSECRKATVDIHVCDYQQDNRLKAEKLADLLAVALTDGDCTNSKRAQWHSLEVMG
ncbi:MAG: S-adenosylmethionine decarboxylase [Verrucomicrobia bacterium]|nr:S-adenosylmethionine decarboxylase [Leptolyngbya sp. ES-bin-22]